MKRYLFGLLAFVVLSTQASLKDVGVIGPKGETLLYLSIGNFIVVKSCSPNTILGSIPSEADVNCQGTPTKIPIEYFKQSLFKLVTGERLYSLKPITPGEILDYRRNGPTIEQIELWEKELEKINNFISTHGAENAQLVRKEEILKALSSQELKIEAIKKINLEVEKTIDLIVDRTKLTLTKYSSDDEQFLYTVLKQFNSNEIYPCGLKGSIDERIQDCSYQHNSMKEGFVLVTRSKDFKLVYKELSTGLLWSDLLFNRQFKHHAFDQFDAMDACRSSLSEVAGLSRFTWRLPSVEEFREAEESGIRKALPNMNRTYWTSTVVPILFQRAWLYDASHYYDGGLFRRIDRYEKNSVRCIAHE